MTSPGADGAQALQGGRLVAGALACPFFVDLVIILEVLRGLAANSEVPAWAARIVPLGWPRVLRVGWWLLVAATATAYRLLLARAGLRQSRWATVASVAPFVVFAAGIAAGPGWATWQ